MFKFIEDYQLQEVLGEGQYGKVYKGLNVKTNELVAIKCVSNKKFKEVPKLEEFTMNEIQTLAQIDNPHVVKFHEMLKSKNHYYFVYEYCNGGDLEAKLENEDYMNEQEVITLYKQLLIGFQSLNKANILHRDIKPGNIIFHNGQAKLADFGFCKSMHSRSDMTGTMVGSPIYMAPEVLLGKPYGYKADIWSLGCVLYECLYKECPFEENSMNELLEAIKHKEVKFPHRHNVGSRIVEILKPILEKDPQKRITWDDLFKKDLTMQEQQISPSKMGNQLYGKAGQGNKNVFNYILMERNKVYFLYQILLEMLDYDFENGDLATICFIWTKYMMKIASHLKKFLVDNFTVNAFVNLKNKYQDWNTIPGTFEYKSFQNLVNKEYGYIKQHLDDFSKEMATNMKFSKYQGDQDILRELENSQNGLNMRVFKSVILNYVEDVKNQYMTHFMSKNNTQYKYWLEHIQKVLDGMDIDYFFDKFLDIQVNNLTEQKYFYELKQQSQSELLTLVTKLSSGQSPQIIGKKIDKFSTGVVLDWEPQSSRNQNGFPIMIEQPRTLRQSNVSKIDKDLKLNRNFKTDNSIEKNQNQEMYVNNDLEQIDEFEGNQLQNNENVYQLGQKYSKEKTKEFMESQKSQKQVQNSQDQESKSHNISKKKKNVSKDAVQTGNKQSKISNAKKCSSSSVNLFNKNQSGSKFNGKKKNSLGKKKQSQINCGENKRVKKMSSSATNSNLQEIQRKINILKNQQSLKSPTKKMISAGKQGQSQSYSQNFRQLPWGVDQQRLKTFAINVLQKMYKASQQQSTSQDHQIREEERRHIIGCDFLNNLDEEKRKHIVEQSKEKLLSDTIGIVEEDPYAPRTKSKFGEEEQQEIKLYMQYKKQQIQEYKQAKSREKKIQEIKKKQNQEILQEKVQSIFERLKKSNKKKKIKQQISSQKKQQNELQEKLRELQLQQYQQQFQNQKIIQQNQQSEQKQWEDDNKQAGSIMNNDEISRLLRDSSQQRFSGHKQVSDSDYSYLYNEYKKIINTDQQNQQESEKNLQIQQQQHKQLLHQNQKSQQNTSQKEKKKLTSKGSSLQQSSKKSSRMGERKASKQQIQKKSHFGGKLQDKGRVGLEGSQKKKIKKQQKEIQQKYDSLQKRFSEIKDNSNLNNLSKQSNLNILQKINEQSQENIQQYQDGQDLSQSIEKNEQQQLEELQRQLMDQQYQQQEQEQEIQEQQNYDREENFPKSEEEIQHYFERNGEQFRKQLQQQILQQKQQQQEEEEQEQQQYINQMQQEEDQQEQQYSQLDQEKQQQQIQNLQQIENEQNFYQQQYQLQEQENDQKEEQNNNDKDEEEEQQQLQQQQGDYLHQIQEGQEVHEDTEQDQDDEEYNNKLYQLQQKQQQQQMEQQYYLQQQEDQEDQENQENQELQDNQYNEGEEQEDFDFGEIDFDQIDLDQLTEEELMILQQQYQLQQERKLQQQQQQQQQKQQENQDQSLKESSQEEFNQEEDYLEQQQQKQLQQMQQQQLKEDDEEEQQNQQEEEQNQYESQIQIQEEHQQFDQNGQNQLQQYQLQQNEQEQQFREQQEQEQQQQDEEQQVQQNQYNENQQEFEENEIQVQEQEYEEYDDDQVQLQEYTEEELEQMAEQIFNNAALYIQKIWRGFYTRKILRQYLDLLEREQDNQDEEYNEEYEEQQEENDGDQHGFSIQFNIFTIKFVFKIQILFLLDYDIPADQFYNQEQNQEHDLQNDEQENYQQDQQNQQDNVQQQMMSQYQQGQQDQSQQEQDQQQQQQMQKNQQQKTGNNNNNSYQLNRQWYDGQEKEFMDFDFQNQHGSEHDKMVHISTIQRGSGISSNNLHEEHWIPSNNSHNNNNGQQRNQQQHHEYDEDQEIIEVDEEGLLAQDQQQEQEDREQFQQMQQQLLQREYENQSQNEEMQQQLLQLQQQEQQQLQNQNMGQKQSQQAYFVNEDGQDEYQNQQQIQEQNQYQQEQEFINQLSEQEQQFYYQQQQDELQNQLLLQQEQQQQLQEQQQQYNNQQRMQNSNQDDDEVNLMDNEYEEMEQQGQQIQEEQQQKQQFLQEQLELQQKQSSSQQQQQLEMDDFEEIDISQQNSDQQQQSQQQSQQQVLEQQGNDLQNYENVEQMPTLQSENEGQDINYNQFTEQNDKIMIDTQNLQQNYEQNDLESSWENKNLSQKQDMDKWNLILNQVSKINDSKEIKMLDILQKLKDLNENKRKDLLSQIDFKLISKGLISQQNLLEIISQYVDYKRISIEKQENFQVMSSPRVSSEKKGIKSNYLIEKYDVGLDRSYNLARKGHITHSYNNDLYSLQNVSKALTEPSEQIQSNPNQLFMLLTSSQIKDKTNLSKQNYPNFGISNFQKHYGQISSGKDYLNIQDLNDNQEVESEYSENVQLQQQIDYIKMQNKNNNNNQRKIQSSFNIRNNNNLNNYLQQIASSVNFSEQMSNNSGIKSPDNSKGYKKDFFQKDPFKEFTDQKIKEMLEKEDVETIIEIRQQAIEHKMNDRIEILDNLLREKTVSPRTYENKKEELYKWADEQNQELKQKIFDFQKTSQFSKTKRDLEFESQKQNNTLSISQINFNKSGHGKDIIQQKNQQEILQIDDLSKNLKFENQIDEIKNDNLENQSKSQSQGLLGQKGVKLYLDEEDLQDNKQEQLKIDEDQFLDNQGKIYSSYNNQKKENLNDESDNINEKNKSGELDLDSDQYLAKSYESGEIQELKKNQQNDENTNEIINLDKQELERNQDQNKILNKKLLRQNLNQVEKINEEVEQENLDLQNEKLSKKQQQEREVQLQFQQEQQAQQNMMEQLFMEMNEEINERWRIQGLLDSRIQEQMDEKYFYDKSENYGICTNLFVLKDYLQCLIQFVIENNLEEFLNNINIPFGFQPSKRLKLIHGYDNFIEEQNDEENEEEEEYTTLPFILSEDLFIKFEQSIIGNGESEKEQIIKEFEHIHNKSIFDSFNEALNTFRPYYMMGGPPYSWSLQEKQILKERKSFIKQNLDKIFKQSQNKVLQWGSYLCGIVNEGDLYFSEEEQNHYSIKNIQFDPNRPLASIMEQMPPEHDVFNNIKEEKLSKLLLDEIVENEYKWCLFEDEKAEVVMELSDLVFEDLVENFIEEMYKDKIDQIKQEQLLDQQNYQENLMRQMQIQEQLEDYGNQEEYGNDNQEQDQSQEQSYENNEDYENYKNQQKQQIQIENQNQGENKINYYKESNGYYNQQNISQNLQKNEVEQEQFESDLI
ncbi:Protein kinase-like domain [Pseudocohnilembus persalinus]|uniref:non-specific serine/threonine protein kinase n=1 Tax=Pseudocohnilembus persalinus TaxID=266149 RepID=A0A0V0R0F0_PSEPJ|nr:Protein kinase-like domain [Pseudocohnilembus persalinus]|eukprot:KRX07982.1 Protein kinase-like domain [Pseudocohnilembus persalinus]